MQQMEIEARDRAEPMPFEGESRPDPEDGFTRHNPADNRFYATPTIFNPANFPWFQPTDIVPGVSWPREVWPVSRAVQEKWRRVMEIRGREREVLRERMEIPYIDQVLLSTPQLKQDTQGW